MKIGFVSSTHDLSVGSYRIWVNDLNEYFRQTGTPSVICESPSQVEDCDVLICSKNDVHAAQTLKRSYPDKKVGIINLAADRIDLEVDFVIVGSLEEKDSLSHYDNVFLFPLIENMMQDSPRKVHQPKDKLVIGYHGSHTHLAKFNPYLCAALEEVARHVDFELSIITSNSNFNWQVGRPNIKNINIKQWSIHSIYEDLRRCDIGLVPNITAIPVGVKNTPAHLSEMGLYTTDYIVRYKNKSNAGRSFVFHQLGVPVVADLTPSNFHILGNPDCGFVAHNKRGWCKSIMSLTDHQTRQFIADNAKAEFDRVYDPLVWAKRLYNQILGV